jgi:hypothetical protein
MANKAPGKIFSAFEFEQRNGTLVKIFVPFFLARRRIFRDFVQFAAVKPNTTTLGTVIYIYSLTVADKQGDVTGWTVHQFLRKSQ